MRRMIPALLAAALLLAACNGQPAPPPPTLASDPGAPAPATPTPETETAAESPAAQVEEATPLPPLNITAPPPGVVVTAAFTDEPPDTSSIPLARVIFQRSGGPSGAELVIDIFGNGTGLRDGRAISVTPEQLAALDAAIRAVDFFNIQGIFTVPGGPGTDQYAYRLSVELEDGTARSLNAQDGYTPQNLLELFALMSTLGQ